MFIFLKNKKIILFFAFFTLLIIGFLIGFSLGKRSEDNFDSQTEQYSDDYLGISFDYLKNYNLYDEKNLKEKGIEGIVGLEKKNTPHIYCLVTRTKRAKSIDVPYEGLEDYIRSVMDSEKGNFSNLQIIPYKAKNYSGAKATYEFSTLGGEVLKREMIVFATSKNTYSLFCTSFASEFKYFEKEFEVFTRSFVGE